MLSILLHLGDTLAAFISTKPVTRLSVLLLVFGLVWSGGTYASDCDSPKPIIQALRTVTLKGQVIDEARVGLPDKLSGEWRREEIKIRYVLDIDGCRDSSNDQTIWLPRVGGPYQFRVDGRLALPMHPYVAPPKAGTEDDEPLTFNGRTSMLFRIPPDANQVSIELQTMAYIPSGIPAVQGGPFAAMLPLQMQGYNEQSGGMTIISLITTLIGFVSVLLWRTRRIDRYILWFGLMCLAWGVRGYFYASEVVNLPPLVFEQINPFVVGLFAITCLQTTLLLLNRTSPRQSRYVLVASTVLVASFGLSMALGSGALIVRSASFGFGLLLLIFTTFLIWRAREQLGTWRTILMVAGFGVLVAASFHDIFMVLGLLPADRVSMILIGFTTLLLAYALVCAQFVIRTLNQVEANNEQLEERVREKTQALSASYEKLRAIELQQALTAERERLLRDMHDGVGAQLMTALRGLERGELDKEVISKALQDGLDDLRMLMDNVDPLATFTDRLAAWRSRWDARLSMLGIQLHWQLGDEVDGLPLSGDTTLQLLRVVQEACTNVIKHAQATDIWLTVKRVQLDQGDELFVEIRDNGLGVSQISKPIGGRGIANMQYRAKQIGAHLALEPPPLPAQGCCVRLWLPLTARSDSGN